MHAMGFDLNVVADSDGAEEIKIRQNEIFDRIVDRRRCLPIDLLRMPAGDLVVQVCAEGDGRSPAVESVLGGLRRYTAGSL
jgi:hypothetical protein